VNETYVMFSCVFLYCMAIVFIEVICCVMNTKTLQFVNSLQIYTYIKWLHYKLGSCYFSSSALLIIVLICSTVGGWIPTGG